MGNEDIGQVHRLLKFFKQVDDLRLDRNVERRYGLVADNKLGINRKGSCDTDSLTLTARELVRIALKVVIAQTALVHKAKNVVLYLVLGHDAVHLNRLGEYITNGASRRKRRVGVLEDDLHLRAMLSHLSYVIIGDILAIEDDSATGGGVELQDRTAEGGLTTARLTNDTESFSRLESKGNVIDRDELLLYLTEKALLNGESFREVSYLENRVGIVGLCEVGLHTSLLLLCRLCSYGIIVVHLDLLCVNRFTH